MCKHSLTKIPFTALVFILVHTTGFAAKLELSDPTRPPGTKIFSPSKPRTHAQRWTLSSTLIANHRRHAVINGQIVVVGQRIQNAKIISIHPNEVVLATKQKRFRIKMLTNKIKDFSITADK